VTPGTSSHHPEVDFGERTQVRALQLSKLKRQLVRVYEESPYYREKFERHDVDPHRLGSLDDYAGYPLFDKAEWRLSQERSIRELGHPFGLHVTCDPKKAVRLSASTGTTGKPTFQGYTEKDRQVANIVGRRLAEVYGLEPGDIVLHGFVLSMWIAGFPVADVMQNIGACVVPVGALSGIERFAQIARDVAAVQLNCTPSYAQYLIEKLPERADIRASDLGIRRLLLTGEPGGSIPHVRERLSEGFGGARVFDFIGATGGSFISSVSCEANDGLHFLAEDYVLLELVEPETLEAVPLEDGAVGEIVFTGLEKECGPLIRWRDGDIVEVKTAPCACGRGGLRYSIKSRADDMLLIRGVNVFPPAIKDVIDGFRPRVSGAIRILLDDPPPVVEPPLNIRVELAEDLGAAERSKLSEIIENNIHHLLRFKAAVELVPPGSFPAPEARSHHKAQLIERRYAAKKEQ
jgi:phenylacetate-CoA ligase